MPPARARTAALRLLAGRRLTEAQLWERLARKGYPEEEIRETVERCRREGFLDDALFAQLFIEGRSKSVGDARLVAELVRRGIDREAATASVGTAARGQEERLGEALRKLFRTRPSITYSSAARALERLGFPAAAIYRHLRAHAAQCGPLAEEAMDPLSSLDAG